MRVPWLYSDAERCAHVLDENISAARGFVVTRCRQMFSDTTLVYQTAPSMNLCPRYAVYASVPPPEHPTHPQRFP